MVMTRTLAWAHGDRIYRAWIEPAQLRRSAAGFLPDLRTELAPGEAESERSDVRLTRSGSEYLVEVSNPVPGRPRSSRHPSESSALTAFELALSETVAAGLDRSLRIHASGAVVDGGAVLLVGPSGSGKSTLAAALAERGHPLLGDDMIPVDRPTGLAHPFPRLVKLEEGGARTLDRPPPRGPASHLWPRLTLLHPGDLGSRWADPAPVRAIFFPRFVPAATGDLVAAGAGDAREPVAVGLRTIAPSAALRRLLDQRLFAEEGADDFQALADVLNNSRTYGILMYAEARAAARRIEALVT